MRRTLGISLALVVAAIAATAPATSAAATRLPNVVTDDMSPPLRGWSVSGEPRMRGIRSYRKEFLGPSANDALSLGPGGSLRRALPPRPWSLSLDVRVLGNGVLELDLGGEPLVLRGGGGWKHVQVVGFDPAEVHVDGSRVVHAVRPGRAMRLRVRRGTAQITGLVATPRDDRAALLLHRLAELHSMTPPDRYPLGTGTDGVLRFRRGWTSGFYAGSLWRAYDVTHSSLFRAWAFRATIDHFHNYEPRVYDRGLPWLESSALAYDRICPRGVTTAHRCRVMVKTTSGAVGTMYGIALGNPGTGAIPTVVWPNRCASCRSSDEVETRIDSVMHAVLFEWQWRWDRANPSPHGAPEARDRNRDFALAHARAVARLLVRPDGSTEPAVRTNRLDGTVLSYERPAWLTPGRTWSRGHAQALYGFARLGGGFVERDLLGVAERMAGYLASSLPASGVPRLELGEPASGPEDTAAGAIAAAGLLHLAAACERVAGACSEGPRWAALGRAMLDAALSRVQPHVPMGVLGDQVYELAGRPYDTGEFLFGIDYALEAVAMAGSSSSR